MPESPIDLEEVDQLIERIGRDPESVIPLLRALQDRYNYLPDEALRRIDEVTEITPAALSGVATFYSQFRLRPAGQHTIRVCVGTACHVKGSRSVLRLMQKELDLKEGETSEDYQFTLETVACLGACFLAPTMMINRDYFGKLSPTKVTSVLGEYQKK